MWVQGLGPGSRALGLVQGLGVRVWGARGFGDKNAKSATMEFRA